MKNYNQSKIRLTIPIIMIILVFFILIAYHLFLRQDINQVQALSKYGSRGQEVIQIQTKLKRWGYYNGNIDGIYGSQTQSAVRYFQSKNGLAVDRNCRTKNISCYGNIFFI